MKSRESWAEYLSTFAGATVEYPFDAHTRVIKVGGKMFALLSEDETPARITLKADVDRLEEWRGIYPESVLPGYHMNKRHWNTVVVNGSIPDDEIEEMIRHSYDLIVASLPRAIRNALSEQG